MVRVPGGEWTGQRATTTVAAGAGEPWAEEPWAEVLWAEVLWAEVQRELVAVVQVAAEVAPVVLPVAAPVVQVAAVEAQAVEATPSLPQAQRQ